MQARFGLLGAVAGFGPPGHTRVSLGGMNMVIHKRGFYEERDCVACHRGSSTTDGPDHGLDAVRVRGSGGHSCLSTRKPDACAGARGAGCGDHFTGRDLFEVGDDHLTFFGGDELCRPCAVKHGVL